MNSEELRILEDERQKILGDILEELETKSLKELFFETRDKDNRMKKAKDVLKELYKVLQFHERNVKYYEEMVEYHKEMEEFYKEMGYKDLLEKHGTCDEDEYNGSVQKERLLRKQKEIDEFENDYSNYIQGGYGFIAKYLGESHPYEDDESELEDISELEDVSE